MYLPLCLPVTSSTMLDRRRMTPHQKVAHMPHRETTKSLGWSCWRTAALVEPITHHPLRHSAHLSVDAWKRTCSVAAM